MTDLDRKFSIAPMMDWSDRHCRMFWRQITRQSVLYTEMVTTGAILHAGPERFLRFHQEEHPIALQLGGSDPEALARCAAIAEEWGYDEVNLNCGCPSDRVQNGFFGACLMARPQLVAACVKAMITACDLPVTVKHRIGIDDMESYDELVGFVEPIAESGCKTFIVHARKAWLQGLSPKQNREIPPLHYDMVYRLKQDFPELEIIINGGITDLEQSQQHLQHVDGIMMGRAAYHNPYVLTDVDAELYQTEAETEPGNNSRSEASQLENRLCDKQAGNSQACNKKSRDQILLDFIPYIEEQLSAGIPLNHITRHVLGLFQGVPGAKLFRRHISQHAHIKGAGIEVVHQARELMLDATARMPEYRAVNQ